MYMKNKIYHITIYTTFIYVRIIHVTIYKILRSHCPDFAEKAQTNFASYLLYHQLLTESQNSLLYINYQSPNAHLTNNPNNLP